MPLWFRLQNPKVDLLFGSAQRFELGVGPLLFSWKRPLPDSGRPKGVAPQEGTLGSRNLARPGFQALRVCCFLAVFFFFWGGGEFFSFGVGGGFFFFGGGGGSFFFFWGGGVFFFLGGGGVFFFGGGIFFFFFLGGGASFGGSKSVQVIVFQWYRSRSRTALDTSEMQ